MKKKETKETLTGLRIGELAKRAAVTPRTIRFYIQEGLLPEPLYTQKNMAYYGEDLVEKVRAIKKAQKERYLPLVVIRKILEENDYDYRFLDAGFREETGDSPDLRQRALETENPLPEDIPDEILTEVRKQQWGRSVLQAGSKESFELDPVLMNFLLSMNRAGASWEMLIKSMREIQGIIGQAVEVEFKTLFELLMGNSGEGFNRALQLKEAAFCNFIQAVREKQLKKITNRHKKYMDNAYLASTDEGYAAVISNIRPELLALEKRMAAGEVDVRILNDLSIGYSCAGELNRAVGYLRRVLKVYPDDRETKVRWFWHRRFSKKPGERARLKQELMQLVEDNPDYAFARSFLAMWHFTEVFVHDETGHLLKAMNLAIEQLDLADKARTEGLHEWMVVQYFKGRILTAIRSPDRHIVKGIDAFHAILDKKPALDRLYAKRMSFYRKWIWPNLYFFLGDAYVRSGRHDEALRILSRGENYHMMPPYKERLRQSLQKARLKRTQS